ncbi:MAG: hypothetical protein HY917_04275 [Candidatus Diapherotrites archaeon]|nr:hypothetical protein [Candidatus Diapherotrites archaeon]
MMSLIDFNSVSSKDLVVQVLAQKWPLKTKSIHSAISHEFGREMSYQAVHKHLNELLERKVVVKNADGFKLNLEWIDLTQKEASRLLEKYRSNSGAGPQSAYLLNSLHEVDQFLLGLVGQNIPKDRPFLGVYWNHFYVPLMAFNKDYYLIQQLASNFDSLFMTSGSTAIDSWCAGWWNRFGVKTLTGVKPGIPENSLIYGDFLVQVIYPKELQKAIHSLYKSAKRVEELDLHKLFELINQKNEIPVLVTRDQVVAGKMRGEMERISGRS